MSDKVYSFRETTESNERSERRFFEAKLSQRGAALAKCDFVWDSKRTMRIQGTDVSILSGNIRSYSEGQGHAFELINTYVGSLDELAESAGTFVHRIEFTPRAKERKLPDIFLNLGYSGDQDLLVRLYSPHEY